MDLPVFSLHMRRAFGLLLNRLTQAMVNSTRLGAQNLLSTKSSVWEKHPTSIKAGYTTFKVRNATLFTAARSRIVANREVGLMLRVLR